MKIQIEGTGKTVSHIETCGWDIEVHFTDGTQCDIEIDVDEGRDGANIYFNFNPLNSGLIKGV